MTEAGANARKDKGGSHRHQEHRERVGNYVVGAEIGRGSFATVYKGHRSKSKTHVAIKAVSRQKLTSKLLDNLESEINILKVISNRNIVALLDCFKNDSHIYLVMEYCSGADLSFYLRYRGRIDTLDFIPRVYESNMVASRTEGKVFWPHPETGGLDERVTRCFLGQLAQAVRFLRSQDLIHRDIKPQNLLLQPATAAEIAEGHPLGIPILKVADFGFARILPAATMAETLCGSPLYMAPEILRYEKYDAKADLWSVGAVLYEMCVGKSPFRAPNHVELLRRIEKGDDRIKFPDESSRQQAPTADGSAPPRITRVSADLKELIRGLLKQRPAERMNFDEFFASGVWEGYMTESVGDVSTSIEVSTDSSSAGDQFMSGLQSQHNSEGRKSSTHSAGGAAAPAATNTAPSPRISPTPPVSTPPATTSANSIPKRQGSRVALGEAAHSSSNAPTPVPRATRPAPNSRWSEPKYYVGDEPAAPELEPSGQSPSHLNSSRADTRSIPSRVHSRLDRAASSGDDASPVTPIAVAPIYATRAIGGSPLAAMPVITSTGKEESTLGTSDSKEYVVVEKRTVEINELADELQQKVSRRPSSGGALMRPSVGKRNSIVARPVSSFRPSSGSPPSPQASYGGQTASSYSPPFAMGTTPPFAVPAVRSTLSRPRQPSLPGTPPVFPPPGSYGISPEHRHVPTSSSPSNALARVLTNTAVKLLNSSANTAVNAIALATGTSVRRWPQVERSGEIDPQESDVLDLLEDTARKAFVLFDFADSRLLQMQVGRQAVPSVSATLTPASNTPPGAAPPPFSIPPVNRRKSSSSSTSSDLLVLRQAEEAASDACALYFKSLAFICAGHERFKKYWDARKLRNVEYQTSAELNEMVQWFRARFNEVYEKAEWAKARCAEQLPDVDKLVHGRARDISRQSAQAELMGDLAVAEEGYDTAMWLLGTLLDDAMYEGVPLPDEDRALYERLIGSISDRLDGLRKKMEAARAGVNPTTTQVSIRGERA